MEMDQEYVLCFETPGVDEYRALRVAAGLTPRSRVAAKVGLPSTILAAVIRARTGQAIAWGVLWEMGLAIKWWTLPSILNIKGVVLANRSWNR